MIFGIKITTKHQLHYLILSQNILLLEENISTELIMCLCFETSNPGLCYE